MRSTNYHDKHLIAADVEALNIYCSHDFAGSTENGENQGPPHQHIKGQFLYTEGGIVHVTTPDQHYFLPGGHYMWIPAGITHSIRANAVQVLTCNIYFPVEEGEADFYSRLAIYPVNELLQAMLVFTKRWNGQVEPAQKAAYTFMLALKYILPETSGEGQSFVLPYARTERLQEVVRYLETHMEENILFPELAKRFGFSERTLSRVFMQELQMTFVQFFTIQRMMRALQLLLEERHTVNETASRVGYNSVPTFSNTFYKIVGTRPSDYIKMQGVLQEKR